jgi:hypothetical protein
LKPFQTPIYQETKNRFCQRQLVFNWLTIQWNGKVGWTDRSWEKQLKDIEKEPLQPPPYQ